MGEVHAFGVKEIMKTVNFLENIGREYLIVTDSDKVSAEKKKEFPADRRSRWLTYQDLGASQNMTTEDFMEEKFLQETYKKLLETYPEYPELPKEVFSVIGVLSNLKKVLSVDYKMSDENTSSLIREYKSALDRDVKYNRIRSAYFDVLEKLDSKAAEVFKNK